MTYDEQLVYVEQMRLQGYYPDSETGKLIYMDFPDDDVYWSFIKGMEDYNNSDEMDYIK
jgi:hypothetical protein